MAKIVIPVGMAVERNECPEPVVPLGLRKLEPHDPEPIDRAEELARRVACRLFGIDPDVRSAHIDQIFARDSSRGQAAVAEVRKAFSVLQLRIEELADEIEDLTCPGSM